MSVTQKQQISVGQPDGWVCGQSASDKGAFFGATPVVQQTTATTATDLTTAIAAVNALKLALDNLGLTA
jgi:hypothetical protein